MNKPKSGFLFLLAVISLTIIFGMVTLGAIKGKYAIKLQRAKGSFVLGVSDKLTEAGKNQLENLMQGAVENASGTLTKKITETEESLKGKLESELSGLAKSQVDQIKLKICRDWGINPQPTAAPGP
ncbi:MAG: hypothetical protein UV73_C0011G0023 [Candidatus Gottesmanbacteria bacterium GW2011_GWA2_43_14]|uniref:Uncharacterized protein n=1 Tax=Candidatus Gottesmanbacteria bacterium GW2011_GWA2_43_14 TaxID=1618443 RepID=A0A0G1FMW3_9BACT|nr:MAG: hypothetical protein UV73_C0011G0023 [Candidatus Gottesmanbacteria bacterium GW2011_GWA2_43_14]